MKMITLKNEFVFLPSCNVQNSNRRHREYHIKKNPFDFIQFDARVEYRVSTTTFGVANI